MRQDAFISCTHAYTHTHRQTVRRAYAVSFQLALQAELIARYKSPLLKNLLNNWTGEGAGCAGARDFIMRVRIFSALAKSRGSF